MSLKVMTKHCEKPYISQFDLFSKHIMGNVRETKYLLVVNFNEFGSQKIIGIYTTIKLS
jgi:hypothetical protein